MMISIAQEISLNHGLIIIIIIYGSIRIGSVSL